MVRDGGYNMWAFGYSKQLHLVALRSIQWNSRSRQLFLDGTNLTSVI